MRKAILEKRVDTDPCPAAADVITANNAVAAIAPLLIYGVVSVVSLREATEDLGP